MELASHPERNDSFLKWVTNMRSINKDLQQKRDDLARETAEFLARGNAINEVPMVECKGWPSDMRELDDATWKVSVEEDRRRLDKMHKKGEALHIKFMPKGLKVEKPFSYQLNGTNMGCFSTLDGALSFTVKV